MLKALIFDMDGTLAETERHGHRVAFNLAFRQAGLDWFWDETLYGELLRVSGGKERLRFFIETRRPAFRPPSGETLDAYIDRLHALKTDHFVELIERGVIPLRPGVADLIMEARAAGLRLAIATTGTPVSVMALLRAHLAPEWFELIAAGDIVPRKKPAPDIYLHVLAKLELPARECLALEDSEHGLKAALGAGIPTVVTVNPYTRGEDFAGAALVTENLAHPWPPLQVAPRCRSLEGSGRLTLKTLRALHARSLDLLPA